MSSTVLIVDKLTDAELSRVNVWLSRKRIKDSFIKIPQLSLLNKVGDEATKAAAADEPRQAPGYYYRQAFLDVTGHFLSKVAIVVVPSRLEEAFYQFTSEHSLLFGDLPVLIVRDDLIDEK